MSDKIKILQIRRDGLPKEVQNSKTGRKNFKPVNDIWFLEQEATSRYKTDELDKTIENVVIDGDKISIVENANANFFVPPEIKKDLESIINETPKTINVIENDGKLKSSLPKEIIELRKFDYQKSEKLKEKILDKLNIQLSKSVKNIKKESSASTIIKDYEDAKTLDFHNDLLKKGSSPKKLTEIKDVQEQVKDDETVDIRSQLFNNGKLSKKEEKILLKVNKKLNKLNQKKQLLENDGDVTVVNDKTAIIVPKKTNDLVEDIIKEEKQNKVVLNDIPVVNNNDFTISGTVDDLEKSILSGESKTKKLNALASNIDNTTILVENLLSEMEKVNNNKVEDVVSNFDDFFNWYKSNKNKRKLRDLAAKTNKKYIKKKKG